MILQLLFSPIRAGSLTLTKQNGQHPPNNNKTNKTRQQINKTEQQLQNLKELPKNNNSTHWAEDV